MKAIKTSFECSACGAILKKIQPLQSTILQTRFTFYAPLKCVCGSKRFNLVKFNSVNIVAEDKK